MDEKPSIVIVEDHPIMREGLAGYFAGSGRWNVAGTAASLAEARQLLGRACPDLLLLDIQLEDGWGLEIIRWLNEWAQAQGSLRLPVITVYSAFDDYPHVKAAMNMGVKAYVTKRRSERELEEALNTALSGEVYIDSAAKAELQNINSLFNILTKRETEILSLVKDGLSNKEIAGRLGIKPKTVENTISCVYDKTGVHSRLELLRL